MEARELAARLDTWVGRGASPSPSSRSPRRGSGRAKRRRKPRNRKRLVAVAFLAALASGWLVLSRHHDSAASSLPVDPQGAAAMSTVPTIDTSVLRGYLDPAAACTDVVAAVPTVSCTEGRISLDVELDDPATAESLYVSRSGARVAPHRGAAACARGANEERSWSRPGAPAIAVGRYECRIEAGHAAIWWFDEHGIVAHAVAPDANLAALFAWWATNVER